MQKEEGYTMEEDPFFKLRDLVKERADEFYKEYVSILMNSSLEDMSSESNQNRYNKARDSFDLLANILIDAGFKYKVPK